MLSEGSQGYSVATGKVRPTPKVRPFPKERVPSEYRTAGGNGVDPQFSQFSTIKAGGSGSGPTQPKVGYSRAD